MATRTPPGDAGLPDMRTRMMVCAFLAALTLLSYARVWGLGFVNYDDPGYVAWVAERKDLLCALFWILAIAVYARYAARPSAGRYAAVFAALALALMSKPMAVTLPLVLLLIDVWPLGRWQAGRAVILEKVPL